MKFPSIDPNQKSPTPTIGTYVLSREEQQTYKLTSAPCTITYWWSSACVNLYVPPIGSLPPAGLTLHAVSWDSNPTPGTWSTGNYTPD